MIYGHDPRTGEPVGTALPETDRAGVDMVVSAAAAAGAAWRATPAAERAEALEAVADALAAKVDELWQTADSETALGEVRLRGEVARTAGQFRLFAQVLRDGGYVDAIIDHADPSATPPRPDVRRMKQPLAGVVAVFAASNFPFAFSVAGGDTASALAAGCAVVVKAHPGHPNTSEQVARIVRKALPYPDLLGLVQGMQAGADLVQHPSVVAAGFTGSVPGGKAIQGLIDEREVPIPFFGELGSVNPVVVLPSAPVAEIGHRVRRVADDGGRAVLYESRADVRAGERRTAQGAGRSRRGHHWRADAGRADQGRLRGRAGAARRAAAPGRG